MRPLLLSMKGFESYCEPVEIDFEKLGQKGLYLIKGKTGAGKTTIFDAITYALYDEPSGEDRDVKMLRSSQATEYTDTEVKLEFVIDGKKYRITRNPEYVRYSPKTKGIVTKLASAKLEYLDTEIPPVEGIRPVSEAIKGIVKLSKSEFTQIAMIAQGKFEKFLLSPTKEKIEIFRNIFDTHNYEKLQQKVQNDFSEVDAECKKLKNNIKLYLQGVNCNESEEEYSELQTLKQTLFLDEKGLNLLDSLVKKDKESFGQLSVQLENKNVELNKVNENIKKANEKVELNKKLDVLNGEIEKNMKLLEESNQELLKIDEWSTSKSEMERAYALLEKDVPLYQQITEKENEINKETKSLSVLDVENQKEENRINSESEDLEKLLLREKSLADAGEKLVQLESDKSKFIDEKTAMDLAVKNLDSLDSFEKNLLQQQEKTKKSVEEWETATAELTEKESLFYKEQAGILAEKLEEGKPCPVCGSVHHPDIAKKTSDAPSREKLDLLKKEVASLQKKMDGDSQKAGLIQKDIENITEKITETVSKYFSEQKIAAEKSIYRELVEFRKNELQNQITDIEHSILEEVNNKKEKERLEKIIPEKQSALKNAQNNLNNNKTSYATRMAALEVNIRELNDKKSNLEFRSEKEALEKLKSLQTEISKIETTIKKIQEKNAEYSNTDSRLTGQKQELQKQINTYDDFDEKQLYFEQQKLQEEYKDISETRDGVNSRLGQNESNIKNLKEVSKNLSTQMNRYDMIKHIYETVAGKIGENGRIMLETFVQMSYLDQILIRANKRLKTMTDGNYELIRTEEVENHRAQMGLEMSVKDYTSASVRPVKGLSGGEKFQASLALALGLSDEIQEASRGIKLESMFIDEGFATLDSERLEKILKALNDLSNSNKLIGMISHVGELEDIPNFIHVVKDEKGMSHVKINENFNEE